MYTQTVTPEGTKLRSYSPSAGLLKFLIFPKIWKKKPNQFATALAHEVRNPLSTINLAAEMLQTTIKDEEQRMYLDIILRGSGRIKNLVTDF
ncbi:MAG: histidine kinase dimerization/phospho-acceptor domain-containing protein [Ferruginibacter sp.]